jgi:hypothetical protein
MRSVRLDGRLIRGAERLQTTHGRQCSIPLDQELVGDHEPIGSGRKGTGHLRADPPP